MEKFHKKPKRIDAGYAVVWYVGNLRHRKDGPAMEWKNGDVEWYRKGVRHREDGPAVETKFRRAWYLHGKLISNYEKQKK